MKVEIEGTFRIFKYANYRRGALNTALARMVADAVAPLPPRVIYDVMSDRPCKIPQFHGQHFRTRSGRCPKALEGVADGAHVRFLANVDWWENGLGGYITRVTNVKVLEVAP